MNPRGQLLTTIKGLRRELATCKPNRRETVKGSLELNEKLLAAYHKVMAEEDGLLAKHDASSLASRLRYHDLDANGNLIARESVTPVASNPARSAPKPAAPSAAPTPAAVIKRRRTVVEEEHFPPARDEDEDEDEDEEQDDEDAKLAGAIHLQRQSREAIRHLANGLGVSSPMIVPSTKSVMRQRAGSSNEMTYNAASKRMEFSK